MRPSHVAQFAEQCVIHNHPLLISGPPGVGKTQVILQVAKKLNVDTILSHPVVSDPTDAKGLPWPDAENNVARFLPFGDLEKAKKAERKTIWFLDDLGQAPPATQASFMQYILGGRAGEHVLSEHITFIAATNRRTDMAGVTGMLEPVKSRFLSIIEFDSHIDDWTAWALRNNIPPVLIAYLRFQPENLCSFKPTSDMTNSPVPRTWSSVAKILEMDLSQEIEHEAICGAIGEGAAASFTSFIRLQKNLPSIDNIVKNPDSADIPEATSALYAVSAGLASKVNKDNIGNIITYLERMLGAGFGEFVSLTVRDAVKKDESICETDEFIERIASGDIGKLIGGGDVD